MKIRVVKIESVVKIATLLGAGAGHWTKRAVNRNNFDEGCEEQKQIGR